MGSIERQRYIDGGYPFFTVTKHKSIRLSQESSVEDARPRCLRATTIPAHEQFEQPPRNENQPSDLRIPHAQKHASLFHRIIRAYVFGVRRRGREIRTVRRPLLRHPGCGARGTSR